MKVIMVETDNGWEYVERVISMSWPPVLFTTSLKYGGNDLSHKIEDVREMFPQYRFELKEISE